MTLIRPARAALSAACAAMSVNSVVLAEDGSPLPTSDSEVVSETFEGVQLKVSYGNGFPASSGGYCASGRLLLSNVRLIFIADGSQDGSSPFESFMCPWGAFAVLGRLAPAAFSPVAWIRGLSSREGDLGAPCISTGHIVRCSPDDSRLAGRSVKMCISFPRWPHGERFTSFLHGMHRRPDAACLDGGGAGERPPASPPPKYAEAVQAGREEGAAAPLLDGTARARSGRRDE